MNRARIVACLMLAVLIGVGGSMAAKGVKVEAKEGPKMMWCHSCGFNLDIPGFRGKSKIYCSHCTDKDGNFNVTHEEVQEAMANWLKMWQPDIDDAKAMKRADHYLKAMPQWAED